MHYRSHFDQQYHRCKNLVDLITGIDRLDNNALCSGLRKDGLHDRNRLTPASIMKKYEYMIDAAQFAIHMNLYAV